jgi:hypothetical protein
VPQVGQHVHAAPLDLRGLRVLVLVHHVLVERQLHQGQQFRLGPGLAEGGPVLPRVPVQDQLNCYHLERGPREHLVLRKAVFGDRPRQAVVGENAIFQPVGDEVALVQGHGRVSLDRSRATAPGR